MPIRIVIYDDNADRRDSLTMLLGMYPEFEVCSAYPDCSDVIKQVANDAPDVILLDIQMPVVDGLKGMALIKKHHPEVKVIMQTVFEDDDKIFDAILNGASGYILKRAPSEKIVEAIYDVMAGGSPMSPSIAAKVLSHFRAANTKSTDDYNLTDKEQTVLQYLVNGCSYKMIADKCAISVHTVNSHIKKIYDKLHVHSASEAVSKAIHERIVK